MHMKRGRAAFSVLGLVALVGIGVMGVSTSVAGAAPKSPANYKNKLSSSTHGWCTAAQGCDGQYNEYGTIDIVKPSYSNSGGYGAYAAAPTGQRKYARVSGAPGEGYDNSADTTESITGCSPAGAENCSGPYTVYGSGTDSVFPTAGFTSSIKIYIDTVWGNANQGQVVDWDTSLNTNTGSFLEDNMFNLCSGSGGWFVSESQNAGGCSSGPTELTSSGWYTFSQDFSSLAGVVYCTYTVLNSSGGTVWTTTVPVNDPSTGQPEQTSATGGPNYGWLPDEDVLGLPIADISLTRN